MSGMCTINFYARYVHNKLLCQVCGLINFYVRYVDSISLYARYVHHKPICQVCAP